MYRPRVIPCLLLRNQGLVKTINFKSPKYIGDPINAVKIFNDLQADELVFLDIDATKNKTVPNIEVIKGIADEAYMPFAVGGGINTIDQIKQIIGAGAEKVVINTGLHENPNVISEGAAIYGSQSIVVCIDVKKNIFGKQKVVYRNGLKKSNYTIIEAAIKAQELGAGEIIVNSVDNDGVMKGYDLALVKMISNCVDIPVVALGGAGDTNDFKLAVESGASAVAAGSMFVYHGPRRGVLINYPENKLLHSIFE